MFFGTTKVVPFPNLAPSQTLPRFMRRVPA
jgi:hypothetical protein